MCLLVDAKQFEGVFPVVFQCGGINDEDVGVFAVGFHKALGYHGGYHGFSQTDDIGEKQTIVLHQHLVALNNRILLVFQILDTVGKLNGEIVFHLIAKGVDEHFDVQLVRGGLIAQIGLLPVMVNIACREGYGLFPQGPEFIGTILDIVEVFQRYIEFVLGRLLDAQTGVGNVGRAHNYPTVAMLAVVLRQAEIEFCMQVFGGVDAHLKSSGCKVLAHLQNAFLDFGRVLGIDNVFLEAVVIDFLCLVFIGQHQECLVVLAEYIVDIDTYQYLDF